MKSDLRYRQAQLALLQTRTRTPVGQVAGEAGLKARRVKDIMKRPAFVAADATLEAAIQKLRADEVGCLPVCDGGGQVLGVITDRDILMRCVGRGGNVRNMRTHDAMTIGARCCMEDDSLEEAARIMSDHHLRRLPVLDKRNQLVGVVSSTDLIGGSATHAQYEVAFYKEILDSYGRPHHVELQRVAVDGGYGREAAAQLAISRVEAEKRGPWHTFADGYDVTEVRIDKSAEVGERVNRRPEMGAAPKP